MGAAFLDEVEAAVKRIAESPRVGSTVPGVADPDIRRRPLMRFPHHVVYLELPDHLRVLAVAHDRRRPGYWVGRLGS
jgi:toxin ParE1/3/4